MSSSRPRWTPSSSFRVPMDVFPTNGPDCIPKPVAYQLLTAKAMLLLRNRMSSSHRCRRRILEHHSILIEDGVITDIGPAAEWTARHIAACRSGGTIVEAAGSLLLPDT